MSDKPLALEISGLFSSYGKREILHNISFSVEKGGICGLLGPNGSGKTTFFRCVLKFQDTWSGSVRICGQDTAKLPPSRMAALVSYVPQDHHAAFPFTVREIVAMGRTPRLSGFFRVGKTHLKAAESAIELLGIEKIAPQAWNTLSGGQRQLALIARAVAQEAPLMLLDEPTSALDFKNQLEVWHVLGKLAGMGFTIIACCHDPNHILWFCQQAVLLKNGYLIQDGKPSDILTNASLNELYGNICARNVLADGIQVVRPVKELISASQGAARISL